MTDKTFLLELREQAQQEPALYLRMFLRDQADLIDEFIKLFTKYPTRANMVHLNGAWARAERYLMQSQQPEPEPPLAGSPEADEDMEEAA